MRFASSLFLLFLLVQPGTQPASQPAEDIVQYFSSIHVPRGAVAGEAICIFCSIRVDGELTDEAVAILGHIEVSGRVAEEVIAVGGSIRLLPGSHVGDEAVAVGGRIYRDPRAEVGSVEEIAHLFFPGQRSFPWPGVFIFVSASLLLFLLCARLLQRHRAEVMSKALIQRPIGVVLLGILGFVVIGFLDEATEWLGPWQDWGELLLAALILAPAWLGSIGLVYLLGHRLAPRSFGWAALGGSSLLVFLMTIPLLGMLIFVLLLPMTWGTALLSGVGSDVNWLSNRIWRRPR